MCDAYSPAGEPIPTNKRCKAAEILSHPEVVAEAPWYITRNFSLGILLFIVIFLDLKVVT